MLLWSFILISFIFWIASAIFIAHTALKAARLPEVCSALKAKGLIKPGWIPFMRFNNANAIVPSRIMIVIRAFCVGPYKFWSPVLCITVVALSSIVLTEVGVAKFTRWICARILSSVGLKVTLRGTRVAKSAAPCLVCNHVSMMDMLTLLTMDCCFVGNDSVLKIVFIGRVCKALKSIFVGRDSPDSRAAARVAIKERLFSIIAADPNSKHCPQLVIFPEGTTTNGTGLLTFRRGAFESGVPIQPVRIEYSNLQCSMSLLSIADLLCYLAVLPESEITVHYLPVVTPVAGELPEALASRCRDAIATSKSAYGGQSPMVLYGPESHRDEREFMQFVASCDIRPRDVRKSN